MVDMEELILRVSEKSFDASILWASEHVVELCGFDPLGRKLSDVFAKDMNQQPCDNSFAFAVHNGENYLLKYINMGIQDGLVVSICKESRGEESLSHQGYNRGYVQDLIDFQRNIVLITDGIALRNCNKSMLSFLGFETMEEFLKEHKCICEFFIEEEGYFSDKDPGWVQRGLNLAKIEQNIKVRMYDITDDIVRTYLMKPNTFSGAKSDYIVSFTDITEVENAQHALEGMNKTLFNRSSIGIVKLDDNWCVSEFNGKALKLLGYEGDDLIGLFGSDLIYETKLSEIHDISEALHCKIIKKDGEHIDALVNFEHIDFINDSAFYLFINDISKLKEMEKRTIDQERMMIQQSKMASLGEMVGLIAHQWQQPLNSIAMIAQMLTELLDDESKDSIEMVEKSSESITSQVSFMADTLRDFKNFLKPTVSAKGFNVVKSIRDVLELYRPQLKYYKISCDVHLEEERFDSVFFKGFENEFKNVILNLLTNSRDVFEERKTPEPLVEIGVSGDDESIFINIEDNAGGMSQHVMDKIFEPYITTKGDRGTGLGLYMSKLIIEDRMKGSVAISNGDMGAKITIRLKYNK